MSTIYDVAKQAGVSAMTVSRMLNNPEKVSKKTRERVQAAMTNLGYKQNHAAKALVSKTTGIVKIVQASIYSMRDPYFTTLFAGISEVLSEQKIAQLVVRDLSPHIKSDGMIIMGLNSEQNFRLEDFSEPVVIFGKGEDKTDWVDTDNFGGTFDTTKHLIELGHTQIAFMGFDIDQQFIEERRQGYLAAMREAELDVKPEWMISATDNITEPAKITATRALRQLNITAMVCSSDIVAFGTIQAAADLGIRIPEDLSVTGFDGIGLDKMVDPKLTTAEQPVFHIGRRLAEILLQRKNKPNEGSPPIHELVSTNLVTRDSTARIK